MMDDRKLGVLRAIVEDFVYTREPVGSKALVERHHLDVSPATIRNDMVALELEGYIAQPHTSAGRVPTDKGYRLFVDRLSTIKPLSSAERRAIETFLSGAVDLDDVVGRTVRLLAQLTRQVAVVQYPSLIKSTIRHVELVPVSSNRLMLVVITDTGRVEQRVVECADTVSESTVLTIRDALNSNLGGCLLSDAPSVVSDLPERLSEEVRPTALAVLSVLLDTLVVRSEEKVVLGGTANLTRFGFEFPDSLRPVLEALEEQVVLMRLLGEATGALTVRIGQENQHEGLRSTSVVTAGYGVDDQVLAKLGVLGPTRMDYPGTMGAVRAVARYVGQMLAGS